MSTLGVFYCSWIFLLGALKLWTFLAGRKKTSKFWTHSNNVVCFRSIGYYLEGLICLAPFAKNPIEITLRGVTNEDKDISVRFQEVLVSREFSGVLILYVCPFVRAVGEVLCGKDVLCFLISIWCVYLCSVSVLGWSFSNSCSSVIESIWCGGNRYSGVKPCKLCTMERVLPHKHHKINGSFLKSVGIQTLSWKFEFSSKIGSKNCTVFFCMCDSRTGA